MGKLLVELGVPAYRSHSGFTGVHRLVGRAWLGKHCSVIMPPLKPMPNTYKYKYKQKNIKQPRNCKTKYIQTNLMWSIGKSTHVRKTKLRESKKDLDLDNDDNE